MGGLFGGRRPPSSWHPRRLSSAAQRAFFFCSSASAFSSSGPLCWRYRRASSAPQPWAAFDLLRLGSLSLLRLSWPRLSFSSAAFTTSSFSWSLFSAPSARFRASAPWSWSTHRRFSGWSAPWPDFATPELINVSSHHRLRRRQLGGHGKADEQHGKHQGVESYRPDSWPEVVLEGERSGCQRIKEPR